MGLRNFPQKRKLMLKLKIKNLQKIQNYFLKIIQKILKMKLFFETVYIITKI